MESEGSIPSLKQPAILPLQWAGSAESTRNPISWTTEILPPRLRLGLSSGRFPSGFPTRYLQY